MKLYFVNIWNLVDWDSWAGRFYSALACILGYIFSSVWSNTRKNGFCTCIMIYTYQPCDAKGCNAITSFPFSIPWLHYIDSSNERPVRVSVDLSALKPAQYINRQTGKNPSGRWCMQWAYFLVCSRKLPIGLPRFKANKAKSFLNFNIVLLNVRLMSVVYIYWNVIEESTGKWKATKQQNLQFPLCNFAYQWLVCFPGWNRFYLFSKRAQWHCQ